MFQQLLESLYTSDRSAQYQTVDIVGAFVGVYGFQIYEMSDHVVLVANTVTSERVPRPSRNVQRFTGRVSFYQRYHFRCDQSLFF